MPTSIHGPFTVGIEHRKRGRRTEVRTGIQVQAGDTITTQSSGEVDFGGAFFGLGAPILDADGDSWPTPSDYPAPSLRKNSLICKIGRASTTFFQGGVKRSFTAPTSGELILDVNDKDTGDNSRGWTVFVIHDTPSPAPPGGPPPFIARSWNFQTIAGAGGFLGANVGHIPAAVVFGNDVHVFYGGENWKLNHIVLRHNWISPFYTKITEEVLDGDGGPGGRTTNGIAYVFQISAVVFAGTLHVFYCELARNIVLRHAFSSDGVNWTFEVVDGLGGLSGRIDGDCGLFNNPIVHKNRLHVFYYGQTDTALGPGDDGRGVRTRDLRHAVFDGMAWQCETLDGQGGPNGRVNADVGLSMCAGVDPNDVLHVFYYDQTNTNLRHARGDGQTWQFEIFDGSGDPNPVDPPEGLTRAKVGLWPTTAVFDNALHVFYHDLTFGNVRLARLKDGKWSFQKLDGGGGPSGRTKNIVGNGVMATAVLPDQLSLFYYDSTARNLRHAWQKRGSNWVFETLDGEGGGQGRINAEVGAGQISAAVQRFVGPTGTWDVVHLFYFDSSNKDLRYAFMV
ncbi:MAG TPA: hypothetical protein VNN20_04505 [Thermodesulfobacteriota bacterium]|nr:hypothetical protein [Thermodesulfobacteriota bacterium]